MKRSILLIIFATINIFAWEINTHRAIDRKAIEESKENGNLKLFLENSRIPTDNTYYNKEEFEGYGMSYLTYITDPDKGEGNGVAKWGQTFQGKPSWQNMIEAGTILEDAQWQNNALLGANGRFLNHFYDPQNGGKGLWWNNNAVDWAKGNLYHTVARFNYYSYFEAMHYFKEGFTNKDTSKRRRFQAKMQKSQRLLAFRVQSSAFRA